MRPTRRSALTGAGAIAAFGRAGRAEALRFDEAVQTEGRGEPISVSLDIHVPGDFASLPAALDWLHARTISNPSAVVRVRLADSVYTLDAGVTLSMHHPQGAQVHILGDTADRDRVKVRVPAAASQGLLVVLNGYSLGLLDGLTIEGIDGWRAHGVWDEASRPFGWGVLNSGGGNVNIGSAVHITRMYYGVRAERGGTVSCAPGMLVDEAGDVGFHAYLGGSIEASRTFATRCRHASAGLGSGYLAEAGGALKADTAVSSDHHLAGFAALSNGVVWAQNGRASRNGLAGFLAANGGHVIATSDGGLAEAWENGWGFRAAATGSIEAPGASAHDNRQDGFSANHGSIDALKAISSRNGGAPYAARSGSVIYGAPAGLQNQHPGSVDATSVVGADPAK